MRTVNRRQVIGLLAAGTAAALTGPAALAQARPAAPAAVPNLGAEFLWGVASAGFQCEGHAPDSNWLRYVTNNPDYDRYGDAVDFFTRYRSDIALAAELGAGVYRISIEWARVQPRPGEWDSAGFAFYDSVLDAMAEHGLRPMLTLDHWVYPGWAAERGGWAHPQMVEDWLANARTVVQRYADRNPIWVTFNEPAAYIMNETTNGGLSPPDIPVMQQRLIQAHHAIYDDIHRIQPGALVTSNVPYIVGTAEPVVNGPMIDAIGTKLDFVGIDYYYGFTPADLPRLSPADIDRLWRMPLQPEGIYYALHYYSQRFPDKPLYVVENGMPTDNGAPRPDGYTRAQDLRDTAYWIQRARADGMNVMGYNYWSITDNYEWGSYRPRFGMYTVDVLTDPALTRRPTDAVAAYRELAAGGGVAAAYRPVRAPAACSQDDIPATCTDPVTVPH